MPILKYPSIFPLNVPFNAAEQKIGQAHYYIQEEPKIESPVLWQGNLRIKQMQIYACPFIFVFSIANLVFALLYSIFD
jgi:hypothetical protein